MRDAIAAVLFTILIASSTHAGDFPRNGLSFLLGDWTGSGSGDPGKGSGSFSFTSELQDHVIIRRAHSEYPAEGKPPVVHDDLLIVYAETSKAIYFDNEGHVIHYVVSIDAASGVVTFLSTDPAPSPLFRLSYAPRPPEGVEVKFEIAPDRTLAGLKTYIAGVSTRRKP